MRVSRILLAAVLLACRLVCAQAGTDSLLRRRIHQLRIDARPAVQAFLTVAVNGKVPLGVILTDDSLCSTNVSLTVDDEPIGDALDALTKQVTGYAWTTDDGIILVSPKDLSENTKKLLELVVPTFTTYESTLASQRLSLWMDVRAVLKPDQGTAIDMLETPGVQKRNPISLQNATVKQILSVMISRPPIGAWVLFPVPQHFNDAADGQFAAVFSYDDKVGLPNISCRANSPSP